MGGASWGKAPANPWYDGAPRNADRGIPRRSRGCVPASAMCVQGRTSSRAESRVCNAVNFPNQQFLPSNEGDCSGVGAKHTLPSLRGTKPSVSVTWHSVLIIRILPTPTDPTCDPPVRPKPSFTNLRHNPGCSEVAYQCLALLGPPPPHARTRSLRALSTTALPSQLAPVQPRTPTTTDRSERRSNPFRP